MRVKRMICMLLVCLSMVSLNLNAMAVDANSSEPVVFVSTAFATRATGEFSMSIPANSTFAANSSFPLEAGETVTIKASYSPFSASVDFGLIDSNGSFRYFNATNGSIDKTILISKRDNYTLAIRNNSNSTVSVSGYVNY